MVLSNGSGTLHVKDTRVQRIALEQLAAMLFYQDTGKSWLDIGTDERRKWRRDANALVLE